MVFDTASCSLQPQTTIPDVFLWLVSGRKRLAYVRIPAYSILFSLVEEQRGRDSGRVTTLYMKVIVLKPKLILSGHFLVIDAYCWTYTDHWMMLTITTLHYTTTPYGLLSRWFGLLLNVAFPAEYHKRNDADFFVIFYSVLKIMAATHSPSLQEVQQVRSLQSLRSTYGSAWPSTARRPPTTCRRSFCPFSKRRRRRSRRGCSLMG